MRIVGWDPLHASAFDRLNREWLERYFTVEPLDEFYLAEPQRNIIDPGGEILFALDGDIAIGCCAAIPRGEGVVELAKLGVTASARGRGIGRRLCEGILEWAVAHGMHTVMLVSSSRLEPALRLYDSLGFVRSPFPFAKPYEEADIYMARRVTSSPAVG